jgi:PASTA domain
MRRTWKLLLGGLAASALLAPATAGAATVTIGSPLTAAFTNNPAGFVGTTGMVSGPNIASPVDGTVINWRTQGFEGTGFRARIIRLGAGNSATSVASGPTIALTGGTTDQALSLPIAKGEIVAFDNSSPADHADLAESTTYLAAGWSPALADNAASRPPDFSDGIEFAYNATVRYCLVPKIKGKKLGAARKALANAACSLGKVKRKKGSKGKFVRSQKVPPGTALGDGAPVKVKVGAKPKKK